MERIEVVVGHSGEDSQPLSEELSSNTNNQQQQQQPAEDLLLDNVVYPGDVADNGK